MKPTRIPVLLVVTAVAGVASYFALRAVYENLPSLPVYGPLWLLLLAIAELYLASGVRARRAGRPGTKPMHAIVIARLAALAKATSPVGALALGFYAGLLGYVGSSLDAATPRHDARVATGGIAASLALIAAALILEWSCRVRKPPKEKDEAAKREAGTSDTDAPAHRDR